MRARPLGSAGPPVPVVGQGTCAMELDDPRELERALLGGLDAGLTHVDTAEMYGEGRVERLVGRILAGRRDEVFLASKAYPHHADRAGLVAACEASLRRLGTDRLDLYLLHWPGPHPIEETIAGFEDLVAAGKIARYGVSNFDADELEHAVRVAGPGRIACDQVLYHALERAIEHRLLGRCAELGVALVAYSPFGQGRFPRAGSPEHAALARVGSARGAAPRQVALAFLLRHEHAVAIPKAARLEHVLENAAAAELELAAAEVAALEAALPPPAGGPLPML